MKKNGLFLILVGFAMAVSACGNQVQSPDPRFLPSGQATNGSGVSSLPEYMQCSESINIKNSSGNLGHEYRACRISQTPGSIKIIPVSQAVEQICVFPAQSGVPLISNYNYMALCGPLSATGSTLNFQGANFDSIYVVTQSAATVFSQCLYYGNPSACSSQAGISYAFGRI